MRRFILKWLIATLAIIVTAFILPGVKVDGIFAAFVVAIVLGFINAFIRPILLILTLPINILSLGLFTLVINAFFVELTSAIVPGFHIRSFGWAVLFSIVLWLIQTILRADVGPQYRRERKFYTAAGPQNSVQHPRHVDQNIDDAK